MCSWAYVWQSQRRDSYQKGVLSSGEREIRAYWPIRQVRFSLGFSTQGGFQVPVFIGLKIFSWGGTKSIIMCHFALGMVCCVVGSGTQQFNTLSEQASWYVLRGGHVFFIWSNLWLRSLHRIPEITWFTVMGCPPLLLSDKCKSIAPFVNSLALDA